MTPLKPSSAASDDAARHLQLLRERMARACERVKRDPQSVALVGASKRVTSERLQPFIAAGLHVAGENYVQEGLAKRDELRDAPLAWHLIGALQSNKARAALSFDLIHSVDRASLVRALDAAAREAGRVQDVLLQINVAGERGKAGCAPGQARELAQLLGECAHLRLCGVMGLPPFAPDAAQTRPFFRSLREWRDALSAEFPACRALSMGMSGDFETAIEEGATLVRIGTALFGERAQPG